MMMHLVGRVKVFLLMLKCLMLESRHSMYFRWGGVDPSFILGISHMDCMASFVGKFSPVLLPYDNDWESEHVVFIILGNQKC